MEKDTIVIMGGRASGKTYRAVKMCGKCCLNGHNVFIIAQTPRSTTYFEEILKREFPDVHITKCKNGIFLDIWGNYMYSVNITNYSIYYEQLKEADTLLIDEFETLEYLIRDNEFIDAITKVDDIIITIANHHLNKTESIVWECVEKLGKKRRLIKVEL